MDFTGNHHSAQNARLKFAQRLVSFVRRVLETAARTVFALAVQTVSHQIRTIQQLEIRTMKTIVSGRVIRIIIDLETRAYHVRLRRVLLESILRQHAVLMLIAYARRVQISFLRMRLLPPVVTLRDCAFGHAMRTLHYQTIPNHALLYLHAR